jgi:glycosyltransferase involved in cell wall biosynthesis
MAALLRDAERYRRLADQARKRAEAFRPRRIAEQMADLYLRLAG